MTTNDSRLHLAIHGPDAQHELVTEPVSAEAFANNRVALYAVEARLQAAREEASECSARAVAAEARVRELECRLRYAESCSAFHLEALEKSKAHADRLWCAAKAAEGRGAREQRLREMWLEERERKRAFARSGLYDRLDELAIEVRDLNREVRNHEDELEAERAEVDRLRKLVPHEFRYGTPETNDAIFALEVAQP